MSNENAWNFRQDNICETFLILAEKIGKSYCRKLSDNHKKEIIKLVSSIPEISWKDEEEEYCKRVLENKYHLVEKSKGTLLCPNCQYDCTPYFWDADPTCDSGEVGCPYCEKGIHVNWQGYYHLSGELVDKSKNEIDDELDPIIVTVTLNDGTKHSKKFY